MHARTRTHKTALEMPHLITLLDVFQAKTALAWTLTMVLSTSGTSCG